MALADPRILLRMKQEGFAQAQRDTYSALCIFANPETRQCWPGQRRLHEVAVLSLGAVNKAIKVLVERGVIKCLWHGRGRKTSGYEIAEDWWDKAGVRPALCRFWWPEGSSSARTATAEKQRSARGT